MWFCRCRPPSSRPVLDTGQDDLSKPHHICQPANQRIRHVGGQTIHLCIPPRSGFLQTLPMGHLGHCCICDRLQLYFACHSALRPLSASCIKMGYNNQEQTVLVAKCTNQHRVHSSYLKHCDRLDLRHGPYCISPFRSVK